MNTLYEKMTNQSIRNIFTHDFILGFFAQFTFTIAYHLLLPTLPVYLSSLGAKEAEIGVLIGVFGVSSLILRPFIGRGLQKIPEKNFMIAGAFLFILTSGALLIAPPFWPFLLVRVFQGIGFAFFNTASIILIANISPEAHRGKSLGYFLLAVNISLALGPPLGMFILNHFSFAILFLVCLVLSLCSLLITHKLEKREVTPQEDNSPDEGFLVSWKAIPPSIVSFFFTFIFGSLTAFFPLYAIDNGVKNPGAFFTTIAIMMILGRSIGGKILDFYSREMVILPCLILSIISMVILSFSKSIYMFILVGGIWGIGHAFLFPSLVAYTLDLAGTSRGLAMGTLTGLLDLGMAVGPVIMGVAINFTNYQIMFLLLALTGIINLIYFHYFVRRKVRGL